MIIMGIIGIIVLAIIVGKCPTNTLTFNSYQYLATMTV